MGELQVWLVPALLALSVVLLFWLLLKRPREGIALAVATMITTLIVNWTQFPTFEYTFNYVLIGLTVFGVIVFATAPWLWREARLSPTSSAHSGG